MTRFRAYLLTLATVLGLGLITLHLLIPALTGVRVGFLISSSMAPEMPANSLIVTAPATVSEFKVGDMVEFQLSENSTPKAHRVIEVLPDGRLKTKGDALQRPDPLAVSDNDEVRRIVLHSFWLGWTLKLLPWVLGVLLLGAAVAFVPARQRALLAVIFAAMLSVWSIGLRVAAPFGSLELLTNTIDVNNPQFSAVNAGLSNMELRALVDDSVISSAEVPPKEVATLVLPPGTEEVAYEASIAPTWIFVALLFVPYLLWLPGVWLVRDPDEDKSSGEELGAGPDEADPEASPVRIIFPTSASHS